LPAEIKALNIRVKSNHNQLLVIMEYLLFSILQKSGIKLNR